MTSEVWVALIGHGLTAVAFFASVAFGIHRVKRDNDDREARREEKAAAREEKLMEREANRAERLREWQRDQEAKMVQWREQQQVAMAAASAEEGLEMVRELQSRLRACWWNQDPDVRLDVLETSALRKAIGAQFLRITRFIPDHMSGLGSRYRALDTATAAYVGFLSSSKDHPRLEPVVRLHDDYVMMMLDGLEHVATLHPGPVKPIHVPKLIDLLEGRFRPKAEKAEQSVRARVEEGPGGSTEAEEGNREEPTDTLAEAEDWEGMAADTPEQEEQK